MGNLCGSASGSGDVQLSPSESTKKKKKKKLGGKGQQPMEVTGLVESVENPMVSRKKKRASALLPPAETDSSSPPSSSDNELEALRVPSATPSAAPDTPASSAVPSPVKLDATAEKPQVPVEVENPGKHGWLHRENEQYEHDKNEDPYLKVTERFSLLPPAASNLDLTLLSSFLSNAQKWVCISNNKLLYCSEQPQDGVKSLSEGFVELTSTTEVRLRHIEKLIGGSKGRSADLVGNYCFMVRDSESGLGITFATTTDVIRDEWIAQIKEAIAGTAHGAPYCSMLIPIPDSATTDDKVVELPHKIGVLKKFSMGGLLGVKSVQKRWFQLDSGGLRYYNAEKMRPATLKRALNLGFASINDATEPNVIELKFEDNPDVLRMEAANEMEATEWRDALRETLLSLRVRGAAGAQSKRRLNLVDVSSDGNEVGQGKVPKAASVSGGGRSAAKAWGKTVYEKTPKVVEMIRTSMQTHFILGTVKDVKALVDGMNKVIKLPGDVIIAQGTAGDLFYILESGVADVIVAGKIVAKKEAGMNFGDMALLNSSARTATIRARQLCHMWSLDRKTFRKVLADQERKALAEKVAFLKQVKLFEKLNDGTLEKIADVMQMAQYEPKQKIFKQGEAGECFYMVQSGKVSIVRSVSYTGATKELCQLGAGRYFGEMALLDNKPRGGTAIAMEKLSCWTIDRSNFTNLLGSIEAAVAESLAVTILKKVKLLQTLNEKQLMTISRCLTNVKFAQGHDIIKQGDDGDSFFIIFEGQVSVQINCIEVVKLGAGACFGEGALMRNEKRSATITTLVPTTCLILSRPDFNKHLGPLDAIMKAEADKRAKPPEDTGFLTSIFGSSAERKNVHSIVHAASASPTRNKMFDLEQLVRVRIIGRGTFSKVYLVRHAQNEKEFALKVLYKDTLANFHQEQAVLTERNIMMQFDNPFITALFATFQDANALYIVQQFVPGGDVWMLLKNNTLPKSRIGGLLAEHAVFYASNALCAIGHLHEHDIIYRDLKPENLGIDSTGFLKLFDFGSARQLAGDALARTMVGTPEYLAPEMVMSRGHNRAMDLWALGILMYEMMTGSTPFNDNNPVSYSGVVCGSNPVLFLTYSTPPSHPLTQAFVYKFIMHSNQVLETAFPKSFSPECRDIILKLLVENPGMRIGMLRNGISDVWGHPYFRQFPLDKVQKRDFVPPYRPDELAKNRTELNDLIIGDFESDVVPPYRGRFDFSGW